MFVDIERIVLCYTSCHIVSQPERRIKGLVDQQPALQNTNTENSNQIFPKKELRGHNPNGDGPQRMFMNE
jgi:hypothetical protein